MQNCSPGSEDSVSVSSKQSAIRVTGNNKSTQHLVLVACASSLKASNQSNPRSGGTTLIVSTPTNLTSTHPPSTATSGDPQTNSWKETSVNKTPIQSPTSTSSPQVSRASLLALLEEDLGWRTPEELSFLRWLGFSATKDPDIFCLKTSKDYLVMTKEKLSRQYLGFSPTSGIELNGKYLIRRAGSPRIERGYSLSDILEENVDERYFLSEKMRARMQALVHEGNPMQFVMK